MRHGTTYEELLISFGPLREPRRTKALTNGWASAHPAHALEDCDADVQKLVDALLKTPCPPLGSVPLTEVLSFEPLRYETGVDTARLAEALKPQSSDPRALLAAAALVFAERPADYRQKDVADETLRRIREVQATGTRFRSQVADRPDLVEADRAAATRLYGRLVELRQRDESPPPH